VLSWQCQDVFTIVLADQGQFGHGRAQFLRATDELRPIHKTASQCNMSYSIATLLKLFPPALLGVILRFGGLELAAGSKPEGSPHDRGRPPAITHAVGLWTSVACRMPSMISTLGRKPLMDSLHQRRLRGGVANLPAVGERRIVYVEAPRSGL
jgi:hypothetical protein